MCIYLLFVGLPELLDNIINIQYFRNGSYKYPFLHSEYNCLLLVYITVMYTWVIQ